MKTIIEVKNIGKKYNINHQKGGYIALRDVLSNMFKNPFKLLKQKTKEEFWALKDINFNVSNGETIGIIGNNGAGKSTLLKILSQITPPTTGEIKIHGTIGSLLEVGTGFHPELTGRENIFLNGAILGIKKKDLIKKFDEIVAFAGIEQFLDTPVKYYSSGMYVRLAFSVAAHMDTDILIIDEVLAVGDIEFQKKCLGKMEDITKNQGRTIIFVSHDLEAIHDLCRKTILIEKGSIKMIDDTDKVLHYYTEKNINNSETKNPVEIENENQSSEFIFKKVWVTKNDNTLANTLNHNEAFDLNIEFEVREEIGPIEITSTLKNSRGVNVLSTSLSDSFGGKVQNLKKGVYTTKTQIKSNFLIPDTYRLRIYAHEKGLRDIEVKEEVMKIKILDDGSSMKSYGEASNLWACVFSNAEWQINKK